MFLGGGQRQWERELRQSYVIIDGVEVPDDWAEPMDAEDIYTLEQAMRDAEVTAQEMDEHEIAVDNAQRGRCEGDGAPTSLRSSPMDASELFFMACLASDDDEADDAPADVANSAARPSPAAAAGRCVLRAGCCTWAETRLCQF